MRLVQVLVEIWLCLLLFNAPQGAGARHAIILRQEPPLPSGQLAASAQDPPGSSESEKETQNREPNVAASTTADSKSKSVPSPSRKAATSTTTPPVEKQSSASTLDPAVPTTVPIGNDTLALPNNGTQTNKNDLPIHPNITPALSVAGAVLMLTGLFYTLIGIKTKWLHIFLSTAYLASLAVTVLIVYVMHSPVSNAIQGAYFVAAFVTGIIFGGGSVVFADVTEGLGCLLGGYSLAMWFLILKPDGLIKSSAGKAIFIACFTLGAFGFYISHWTRAYALIGATSFAGATVIVLGIDCFSRAGLKEFWLYIWGLNNDMFPLRYEGPYPHTRGIRVEIAAIVLIFLVGVMSQLKVWRIIQQRRENRATEHLRKQQLQEQAEDDLGRRIEEGNARDRSLWEAAYGGKTATSPLVDSGFGTEAPSVRKASSSAVGTNELASSRTGSIEMDDLQHAVPATERDAKPDGKGKGRATITVRVASDDEIVQATPTPGSTTDGKNEADPRSEAPSSQDKHKTSRQSPFELTKTYGGPQVVALPFNVPVSDPDGDRRSSIAASLASEPFSTRVLKGLSGAPVKHTSSRRSRNSYVATSTSEEALMIPYNDDDDRASSVEATVDEVSDGHQSEADGTTLAGLPTPDADPEKLLKFSPPTEPHPVDRLGRQVSKMSLGQASSHSLLKQDTSAPDGLAKETQFTAGAANPSHGPVDGAPNSPGDGDHKSDDKDSPVQSIPGKGSEQPSEKPALRASLADLDNASKVVMAYRTNEWAKHLNHADKPSLDDIRSVHRQKSLSVIPSEQPVPVNVSDLAQTPVNAEPAPAAFFPKLDITDHPGSINSSRSQESLSRSPQQQRTPSRPSLASQQRPHQSRHTSQKPQHTPTIEEDMPSTSFPHRPNLHAIPTANTLLSHRETLLQQRPASTSLSRMPSSFALLEDDDDNAPLSQRRQSLLHNHANAQRRISSSPLSNQYNHNRLSNHDKQTLQLRQSQLLAQKRRSENSLLEREREKGRKEREADELWRQGGGMEERHREAMRRMQAGVGNP
ncbi:MAG: hypothetical protein Q9171_007175 [Xanthocarpia ochracea]